MGQACLLISPGQAGDVGHRDPHPCVGGAAVAMARGASPQKRPRGHGGTGLRVKAGKSPWVYACPFNDPGPRKSNLFLSFPPLPASTWSLGPTGVIVSPRPSTLTLKAAASLRPDQKPTLNTALTPPPSPPILHPEGSIQGSWQGQEVGHGSPGPARPVCSSMTGVCHCHSSPANSLSSSAKRSGKRPHP